MKSPAEVIQAAVAQRLTAVNVAALRANSGVDEVDIVQAARELRMPMRLKGGSLFICLPNTGRPRRDDLLPEPNFHHEPPHGPTSSRVRRRVDGRDYL